MNTQTAETTSTHWSQIGKLGDPGDADVWLGFYHRYWRLVEGTARRYGLSWADAKDVAQETFLAVAHYAPALQREGKGRFRGWLLTVLKSKISNLRRERHRNPAAQFGDGVSAEQRGDDDLNDLPDFSESELEEIWRVEWEKFLTDAVLDKTRHMIKNELHFQIFELLVAKGMPVEYVKQVTGASQSLIYVVKHRYRPRFLRIAESLRRDL